MHEQLFDDIIKELAQKVDEPDKASPRRERQHRLALLLMRDGRRTKLYKARAIRHFWERVKKTETCWIWTGQLALGYGRLNFCHKLLRAHRVSYAIHNGFLPQELLVCHSCDNPKCVNPAHLFLGTVADNVHDSIAKGRSLTAGEQNPAAKLSTEQVLHIREQCHNAKRGTQRQFAKKFGVSESTISCIVLGKSWFKEQIARKHAVLEDDLRYD